MYLSIPTDTGMEEEPDETTSQARDSSDMNPSYNKMADVRWATYAIYDEDIMIGNPPPTQ